MNTSKKNQEPSARYDTVIIGGGITGSALLYVLGRYTNLGRLVLFEKYREIAALNSHFNHNSQTLHFGDIETNYSLEKARRVKEAADILARYLESRAPDAFRNERKMVLAVGEAEVAELEKRFREFREFFPELRKIGKEEIAILEPRVIQGRDPKEAVLALVSERGYTVNYRKLAESFVAEARAAKKEGKQVDVFLGEEVLHLKKTDNGYLIKTRRKIVEASAVAVAAGPHSLLWARSLGYGRELGVLPVAGSFYCATNALGGKVYTMQIKKLPFAAIHGDPDVNDPTETRFGPTAKVLPLLERHHYRTFFDFLRTSVWSFRGVGSLLKIILDRTIFLYVLKNILYDLPLIGKMAFLKEVRKIIPELKYSELRYGHKIGGIRPQVVNTRTMRLEMGEVEITGERILFNVTPSPGASVSLKNAEQEAVKLVRMLGPKFYFDTARWCKDFKSTMFECRE